MRYLPVGILLLCFNPVGGWNMAQDDPSQIIIGTWNLEWFYDDDQGDNLSKLSREKSAPSKREWEWKLNSVAEVIGEAKPYIMAFQEVENRKVMFDLRNLLKSKFNLSFRIAFVEGFDTFTEQDVAVLFRQGLVEMSRKEQNAQQWQSKKFKNLSKHLIARFEWGRGPKKEKLSLFNMHLRAMAEREDLRIQQSLLAREWINQEIKSTGNVVVVGDFNTEHSFGLQKNSSDIGTLRGLNDPDPLNDLVDSHEFIAESNRATHLTGKQYDRILFSRLLKTDEANRKDLVFSSAYVARKLVVKGSVDPGEIRWKSAFEIPQKERDISDHYPVFSIFEFK